MKLTQEQIKEIEDLNKLENLLKQLSEIDNLIKNK